MDVDALTDTLVARMGEMGVWGRTDRGKGGKGGDKYNNKDKQKCGLCDNIKCSCRICYNCKGKGHISAECPSKKVKPTN
jgi:hypothetical protein